jgi:AcrR family transcriptional regulator
MSYPRKLNRDAILEAALIVLEREGPQDMSMRSVAAALQVAPNALYRYFSSKGDLVSALAEAGSALLLEALRKASEGLPPILGLRAMAHTYIDFARSRPSLYQVKMAQVHSSGQGPSHDAIWAFVLDLAATLPLSHPPREVGTALWASLHGLVELDRLNQLEGRSPQHTLDVMLDLTTAGLVIRSQP